MSGPSPSAVGNKFVVSYYTQLNTNPSELRRFYKENAALTHGSETSFGANNETATGVEEIDKKIQQLDFRDGRVTLSVVDCQASQNGILVLVVGHLSNKAAPPRKFVQSFFLIEQNKTYFVLNDVFRYLEEPNAQETPAPSAQPEPTPAKEEPAPQQPAIQEPPARQEIPESKPHPVKETKPQEVKPQEQPAPPKEQPQEPVKAAAPPPAKQAAPPKRDSPKQSAAPVKRVAPPEEKPPQPAGPKSWSNIVGGTSPVPQPAVQQQQVAQQQQQEEQAPAKRGTPQQPPKRKPEKVEDRTSSPSLFINNVPFSVTEEQMRSAFAAFGEVKSVSIVSHKGFVFLDFATVEQAQKAIDGAKDGQMSMDGRVLTVVEAKNKKGGPKDKGSRPPREKGERSEGKGERRESRPANGKQQSAAKQ